MLCNCEQSVLSVLPDGIDCSYTPRNSQIAGIVMLPLGAALPTDWQSAEAFLDAIDNTETAGRKGKYFIGIGDIPESEDITVRLGRTHQEIIGRRWTLNFAPGMAVASQYAFLQNLQKTRRNFRFWFATMGGRLLGGANGIRPDFVTAKTLYGGGAEDLEVAKLVLQWQAMVEPDRAHLPALFDIDSPAGLAPGIDGGMANIRVISQAFIDTTSGVLTFTENGGTIPTDSLVGVYMNGQRLLPIQYIRTGNIITIDANSYFEGANFEVVIITLQ
jgi:hypothetical protein